MANYKEYKALDLSKIGKEVLDYWRKNQVFEKSISEREGKPTYTFYEGPPSANGMPGIHHVMARSIKDIFCRYNTLKGYQVKRKGGWDTHGLPIELAVEKKLGITKEDIGKKVSVDDYNKACKEEVMRYTDVWNDLTEKMGYWVDLKNPYITYENNYIESLWWILKQLYDAGFLYKGYTIQPYSPAAGTGLSSHELNQPGCYKEVKDTTIVAQFRAKNEGAGVKLFDEANEDVCFLAWTTTPWTLPSNSALAVGKDIEYVKVKTFNQYTHQPVSVILAKNLIAKHFKAEAGEMALLDYKEGDKLIPWQLVKEYKGADLEGVKYEQLLPYVTSNDLKEKSFRVILGDFVTTEDGTGIVHIAPHFGADDFRVGRESGILPVGLGINNYLPLVDRQGKFVAEAGDLAGRYVKEEYYSEEERKATDFKPTDVLIAIKLKEDNKTFKVEKYEHSYPHCWRTDKPVLYYPLDSWFVKTTAIKDKLVANNKTINWKPEATGSGRFGNWLENLVDWNLSRSRYWGTPLPIWRTEEGKEERCIGSYEDLKAEIQKSVEAGFMPKGFELKDFHRPYVDDVILVSSKGEKMFREPDLIDVWFDSGAMPYAQWHYPFENKEEFEKAYPADFIAEGVDQTRGWFFTLHAIAVLLSEASDDIKAVNKKNNNVGISFKNVVSNGLVLDKNGNKMSKRLGNAVDPFDTIEKFGADATRWYMISNASPWDNLKFNIEGIGEVQRKFFGTLYNTYSFFALYANIDGFKYEEAEVNNRPEIDRWVLSLLNTLTNEVDGYYKDYEPTKAARAIQNFVDEHLSNWYVRLCRRRFWKGDYTEDKVSAYQTLYTCLLTIAKLMSPIAPFYSDRLYQDLNTVSGKEKAISVHLADFPPYEVSLVDKDLEQRMALAQAISSLTLSLRKKVSINVRQPLSKILLPVLDDSFEAQVEKVKDLILSETNIKAVEFIKDTTGLLTKKVKPNFKVLGAKLGKDMKEVAGKITELSQSQIADLEREGQIQVGAYSILLGEVEILAEDVQGWQVAIEGRLTVALDITITEELKQEGLAREIVRAIQNVRKNIGLEVTDKIKVEASFHPEINAALQSNLTYICGEILATDFQLVQNLATGEEVEVNEIKLLVNVTKV